MVNVDIQKGYPLKHVPGLEAVDCLANNARLKEKRVRLCIKNIVINRARNQKNNLPAF